MQKLLVLDPLVIGFLLCCSMFAVAHQVSHDELFIGFLVVLQDVHHYYVFSETFFNAMPSNSGMFILALTRAGN